MPRHCSSSCAICAIAKEGSMDWNRLTDRSSPLFWVALTILGLGVIWLAGGVFSLLGSVILYAIVFSLVGGALYAADEDFRTTLLRRRSTRRMGMRCSGGSTMSSGGGWTRPPRRVRRRNPQPAP